MSNASHLRGSAVWMNFPRVICERWYHENVVLMGDAAATGHFSIGSGTRLAFDSAIALAEYLHTEPTMEAAFQRYQDERRVEVLRLQSAARNSLEWFEQCERYLDLRPGAVQLLAAHPLAAHLAREPAPARPAVAALGGGLVPSAGRRHAGPRADVRAVPLARHAADEPGRRVADGAVQGGRRLPHRLALRALRRAGEGRRRAGLHRDDVRLAGGSHHARLHRPVRARARGGVDSDSTDFVHAETAREDVLPDRPLAVARADAAGLGEDRRAAGRRQLAGDVRLGDSVVAGATRCRGRWTAPTWTR